MVKRGIGAAVLAIITALIIGYLLKGKGQERQDVVNMTLPGAQDVKQSLNIPALKGDNAKNLVQKTNSVASESVVASADGAADKANQATKDIKTKEIAVNTFKNKGDDLDFTLRPPKGEKREIVDNIGKSESQQRIPKATTDDSNGGIAASASANRNNVATNSRGSSGSITRSSSQGTVVASSDRRSTYRPRLEGERKRSPNYVIAEKTARQNRQRQERAERRKERAEQRKKREKKEKKEASSNVPTSSGNSNNKKGHYAIQLLATSSASRAKNLKSVMKKEGYSTFISKTTATGKVLFRVRIGNYSSQKKAKSAQRSMQRRYRKNEQVKNSIIVSR